MIQAAITYHKQKVIHALRYHFIKRREIKVLIILVNVFALVSALLYGLKKVTPSSFMLGSLMWFLLMLTFWFILPRIVYRRSSAFFTKNYEMTLDSDGLSLSNDSGKGYWAWHEFQSMMESPHFFHLYIMPTQFILVPKDAFSDDDEVHHLRRLLKDKLKEG